jgi:hypothetical protein
MLRKAIDDKFKSDGDFASCENVQVINVQLSAERDASLIVTQVAKQKGKTK